MENKMDQYEIAEFVFRGLKGELSDAETEILNNWISKHPNNRELYNKIISEKNIREKISKYDQTDMAEAWSKLEKHLGENRKSRRINFSTLIKYAAAACIAILFGVFILLKQSSKPEEDLRAENTKIVSGTQKATLTTSNNEKIVLGEFKEVKTFSLRKAMVKDIDNTLTYQDREELQLDESPQLAMNTLETPRGGEYSLVLSDGTKVFLNAETKLTFPEVFSSDTREVMLEGEAYFEVAESETKAFIVKTTDYDIRVYGTSFNVSAYSADGSSHTTLVHGSVGLSSNTGTELRLIPGEQAYYNKKDNSFNTKNVDTRLYTAWKDGKLMFDDESLEKIMRKLERWYNIETKYVDEEIKDRHFSGTLDRYDNITDVLDIIALTTPIDFDRKGNIIYVRKKGK